MAGISSETGGSSVAEVIFTDDESVPIVARPPAYSQVIAFSDSEAEIVEGRSPGYSEVVFEDSEVEPLVVDCEPAYEIIFDESEAEPIIGRGTNYDSAITFDESTGESTVAPVPPGGGVIYHEPESYADAIAGTQPYEGVIAPRQPPLRVPKAQSPIQYTGSRGPKVIADSGPRKGPMPVERTEGLTQLHRQLLGKRVVPAETMERWGTREAGRAWVERLLSPSGTSRFLADYKDRWVHAHRHVIKTAARQYDIPDWVLGGVAWTEVGGDPEVWDEIGLLGLQPEKVSFGPVQMELRRAAEELGYDPKKMSPIQRRVIIWSLLDPQQNIFLAASHLDRLRNVDVPGRPGSELTDEDIRVLGTRYNRGPELTREQILTTGKRTHYGDNVMRKRERVERLLTEKPERSRIPSR